MSPQIIDIRPHHTNHTDNQSARLNHAIVSSLQQAPKSMPQMVLYDDVGLQLFEDITNTPEYYLTRDEIVLLDRHAKDIATFIKPHAVVVELGAGSLRKTRLLLDAIDATCKEIEYYALDVALESLFSSLEPLKGRYKNVTCNGLHGTYDDAFTFLGNLDASRQRVILWLGSSIGNDDKQEAMRFVKDLRERVMNVGDVMVVGIDRRNDPEVTKAAYDDAQGITKEFYMNGLDHANAILVAHNPASAKVLLDRTKFEYVGVYNEHEGRHEAYYESTEDQWIGEPVGVSVGKGERILIEYSCKYSLKEIGDLVDYCGLQWVRHYRETEHERFGLHLFQVPAVHMQPRDYSGGNAATMDEFEEVWKVWDVVMQHMVPSEQMLQQPIDLRLPFIFYLGHLPTFMDQQLAACLNEPVLEPVYYGEIFTRGMDPDVENPSDCHDHSLVPTEWPSRENVLEYQKRVRERVRQVMQRPNKSKRLQRVLHMVLEHDMMHLETVMYMIVQAEGMRAPPNTIPPQWDSEAPAPPPKLVHVDTTTPIDIGHDDDEDLDDTPGQGTTFGWDNEHPRRTHAFASPGFHIEDRPVTNGEYAAFVQATGHAPPKSWTVVDGGFSVRSVFGPAAVDGAGRNWPVQVSQRDALAYIAWRGGGARLPTHAEYVAFKRQFPANSLTNTAFKTWTPRPVTFTMDKHSKAAQVYTGGMWEWTSTVFAKHEGYKASKLYPGYSADFFDGKHYHIDEYGSWATSRRLADRPTFANWFHHLYEYAFIGFRCVVEQ